MRSRPAVLCEVSHRHHISSMRKRLCRDGLLAQEVTFSMFYLLHINDQEHGRFLLTMYDVPPAKCMQLSLLGSAADTETLSFVLIH
jgi:hypothetical protein